jgi:hypothetical protein
MNHNLTDFLKQAKRFIGKVPFTFVINFPLKYDITSKPFPGNNND